MRKPTIWVPTRSDTNRPVQSQKMVKMLEILDLESRGIVSIRVAKTKALMMISSAVTAKLICAFVFAYADCWFSHNMAQLMVIVRFLVHEGECSNEI